MLLNLHQCDFSASRCWTNAEIRCLGYEIIVLRPLKPVNLLSKNAVEAMSFICFAIVFRPSATILYEIFNKCFLHCSEETNFQKYFRLCNDELCTHNECCTIAVLFFVFAW